MEFLSVLDLARELIWPFFAAVLALLITGFTHLLWLLRRPVPPEALLAGPILLVASLWLTIWFFTDPSVLDGAGDVEAVVQGFGTTLVVGPIFALPTFAVAGLGLAITGPRLRPWDTRTSLALALLGVASAAFVAFGVGSNTGNPMFAWVRGVSYLLLASLVAVAALESARPTDASRQVAAGAAASVLPVLWLAIAESSAWGYAHVLIPRHPQSLDPEHCVELWPAAVDWMLNWMYAELPFSRAAFACAAAMAVVGTVRQYRARGSVTFVLVAGLAVGLSALLWGSAKLDDAYLLALSAGCPSP